MANIPRVEIMERIEDNKDNLSIPGSSNNTEARLHTRPLPTAPIMAHRKQIRPIIIRGVDGEGLKVNMGKKAKTSWRLLANQLQSNA